MSSIAGIGTATTFASFISEYQTPIRLVTLAILGWSFVSINKEISNFDASNNFKYSSSSSLINDNNNNNNKNQKEE